MKKYTFILIVSVFSLFVTFICQKDALFNIYTVNDDVNQYIFPFYRIQDPRLFQNDFLAEYSLKHNAIGVVAIYSFLSKFLDPLLLSKILPFILCSLSAIYFFLIGDKLHSASVGFLSSFMFIGYSWTFHYFSGGHARAFVFPLLVTFVYYLIKEQYLFIGAILFLQILFYPPLALISIFALCILLSNFKGSMRRVARDIRSIFFVCAILSGISMLCLLYMIPDNFMGHLVSLRKMISMPEFFSGGRTPFFVNLHELATKKSIMGRVIGLPIDIFPTWFLLCSSALGLFLMFKKKIVMHTVFNSLLISSLFLYVLSCILLLKLFYPGRYLKFVLPVYLILLAAIILNKYIIEKFSRKKNTRLFALSIVLALIFFPFLKSDLVTFKNENLYKFLSTLPENSLIAGHPSLMNEIPLFSKRKVFIQKELSLPFHDNYYQEIKRRTYAFFELYYSSRAETIENICRVYNIDYVVIKKEHFSSLYLDRNNFYIEPFNYKIKETVLENRQKGFKLLSIPHEYKTYEDNDFIVIDVGIKKISNAEYFNNRS